VSAHASQAAYDVRFEWGEAALRHVATARDVVIVVDVLSFSTCVDIACARGAAVLPCTFKDERAAALAREQGAVLAGARGGPGFSLSPVSLLGLERGTRLVLPSPNGAALSLAAPSPLVLAGTLRNAAAVARHAATHGAPVVVVAAGERWPDGSLRPAVEDMLGAGAIIDALGGSRSPEAALAAAAFNASRDSLGEIVGGCASAVELQARGFADDVALALALNESRCVPRLLHGAYVAA
jgi:2-phosphosulfolactate phosphatase